MYVIQKISPAKGEKSRLFLYYKDKIVSHDHMFNIMK